MPSSRKIIISLAVAIIVLIATFSVVYFIKDRQLFAKKASVPTGTATVSLTPATATLNIDQPLTVTVNVNPAGVLISGIAIRLKYNFSGDTPQVMASNIQIAPGISASDQWSCPVKSVIPSAGQVSVDMACINTSTEGFTASLPITFATFSLTASQVPPGNSLTVSFDPLKSIITRKSDGEDILLTPSSTGIYSVNAASPTSTPAPTSPPDEDEPNSCGGTCGSNANCQSGLFCFTGVCRSPVCPDNSDCNCVGAVATPTPTPAGQLPQTGAAETTLAIGLAALLFFVTGTILYVR